MTTAIAAADGGTSELTPSRPVYDGKLSELYGLYLRHLVMMLLTLGWSRFWGRTRLRRYLWNHFAILGDRFEYRGRGIELFVGFVIVLAILGLWAAFIWLIWDRWIGSRAIPEFGFLNLFSITIVFIGFPLAFVGQYAGLRYKLTRTRWRGIRGTMSGSAWTYGALAAVLTFANAMTGQLMTPLVSVNLARPRISHAAIGTQRFEFAGHAADIYGRFIGYYFLNILAWIVAFGIGAAAVGGAFSEFGIGEKDFARLFAHPGPQTVLLLAIAALAIYTLFGLLILPLRCWWLAYYLRYIVARTRSGKVLFATSITTGHMWGFLVLNYLIVVLTLGLGWPWVMHRTLRLIANELWVYGMPDGSVIRQPADRPQGFGEGLLDMFDVIGF